MDQMLGPRGFRRGLAHGPGPFFLMRHRSGRARRGDVRAAVLALLAERPMHGYEMIQELESRTSGVWRPSPGSVYPTLQLLEDEGLVDRSEADGKRLYTLTAAGRAEAERTRSVRPPWEQVTAGMDQVALDIHDVGMGVLIAARQVVEAGSDDQKARAVEVLTETRRRLYGILAEPPGAAT